MEQNKKIKVAMICHFSNAEVRKQLPLGDRLVFKHVRKLLGLPAKNGGYADIAPWNSNMIKCVKEREDIDLYVLSAHGGLKHDRVSFDSEGIHYMFFQPELTNFLKHIIPSDALWRKLNPMAAKIRRQVNRIDPDLVILVGAENAYYSCSVLSIKNYPVYVLCQNVINSPEYLAAGTLNKKNATTEREIISRMSYMAVYSKQHYNLLRQMGYKNYIFSFNWPVVSKEDFVPVTCSDKEYDFINFALHMSREKGFHDCIEALAIVKTKYPKVRLCLVDGGYDNVREELKKLIADSHLEDNVAFVPFFAERNDLFQFLQKVRFAVLPCKMDYISGTQLQSMKYGLPLVCYRTEGTPSLNRKRNCVLIADMDNVKQLADKMILLMSDAELANELRNNSLEYTKERRQVSLGNMQRLADNFNAIIAHFRYGTPIPGEQLFEKQLENSQV